MHLRLFVRVCDCVCMRVGGGIGEWVGPCARVRTCARACMRTRTLSWPCLGGNRYGEASNSFRFFRSHLSPENIVAHLSVSVSYMRRGQQLLAPLSEPHVHTNIHKYRQVHEHLKISMNIRE